MENKKYIYITQRYKGVVPKTTQKKEISDACQALGKYTAEDILDYLKHHKTCSGQRRIRLPTLRDITLYISHDVDSEFFRAEGVKRKTRRYRFIGEFKRVKV